MRVGGSRVCVFICARYSFEMMGIDEFEKFNLDWYA